jgi:hypothetical protein
MTKQKTTSPRLRDNSPANSISELMEDIQESRGKGLEMSFFELPVKAFWAGEIIIPIDQTPTQDTESALEKLKTVFLPEEYQDITMVFWIDSDMSVLTEPKAYYWWNSVLIPGEGWIIGDLEGNSTEPYRSPFWKTQCLLFKRIPAFTPPKKVKKAPSLPSPAVDGLIKHPSNIITKATIEALPPGAMQPLSEKTLQDYRVTKAKDVFWRAYPFEGGNKNKTGEIRGFIGLAVQPAEAIWDQLQRNGALAVQVQFALWALAYAATDGQPSEFITVDISHFCDQLGYKQKNRAHKRETKQAVMNALEYVTSLHLLAEFILPNGKTRRLKGPLWVRGASAEDEYGDLFGANRVTGTEQRWEPAFFRYAPGDFFSDPEFRRYNAEIAYIGEGILRLKQDTDKYAIFIGGYLATIARMNGYRTSTIKIQTLAEKSGLLWVDGQKNPKRVVDRIYTALDRLKEVGVIQDWTPKALANPGVDYDNLSNPETRKAMIEPPRHSRKEFQETVEIIWPQSFQDRANKLRDKRQRYLEAPPKKRKDD